LDISSRIPKQREIAPVYAVIVMMVYGWTILKFNYNLPGWLFFLNLEEILSIFAYSTVTNLFESLFVLAGVMTAGITLPRKLFSDAFIARGTSLAVFVLGFMMHTASQFKTKEAYPAEIVRWAPAVLILIGLVVYMIGRIRFLRRVIELFADRAIIFLYLSIPISVLSMILVLFRLVI